LRSESINVEIPSVHVFYPKKEKAALIEFIPPGKYLVRVSAKKKVLEYEVEVKSYTESHLLFDLKKMKVSLLKEDKIIAIKTLHVFKDTLHNSKDSLHDSGDSDEIFTVVEEMPCFPGGDEARIRFLQLNIHYPGTARNNGIQGKVFVTFVVEKDGSLSNFRVLRGIGGGCDEEAVRVIKMMPKWIPGRQRGKPVRVQFNVPIRFTLTQKGY